VLTYQIFECLNANQHRDSHLLPDIRVIPHYNKFFKWIPDSAATVLLHAPDDQIVLGIDELTALVKSPTQSTWQVHGEAKVHVLKGLPTNAYSDGEEIDLPFSGN
jgi:cyanophycinase